MSLEDQLRSALRPQDPDPAFAVRVRQQAESGHRFWSRRPWLWPAVAVATIVISISASLEYRRIQAENASRQAIVALRIASEKLNNARSKVLKLNTEN